MSTSFRSRKRLFRPELQFDAKSTSGSPPKIELEPVVRIGKERQAKKMITANGPIPASMRVKCVVREETRHRERLVREPYTVASKIVARISNMPKQSAEPPARSIPGRRDRFVCVSKQPERVNFLPYFEATGLLRDMGADAEMLVGWNILS